MLTESKKLNIAIILLIIFYAIEIFVGILYASIGFMPYHQIKPSLDPDWKEFIMFLVRYNGFLFIHNGVMGLYILYVGFQKKEKWAWVFVLLSGVLTLFPLMGLFIMVNWGFQAPVPNLIIGMIPWIVALGISYKEFFGE